MSRVTLRDFYQACEAAGVARDVAVAAGLDWQARRFSRLARACRAATESMDRFRAAWARLAPLLPREEA